VKVSLRRDGAEVDFRDAGQGHGVAIRAGDIVVMQSAGGGGYGDPLAREPDRVRDDVRAGYVSPERARLGYGVLLTSNGEVDIPATQAERARLTKARRRFPVIADEREPVRGRLGRHRVLRMAPAMAADLLGWLPATWSSSVGGTPRHSAPGCASIPTLTKGQVRWMLSAGASSGYRRAIP
jgi:N-methylhydantoinase B